MRRLRLALLATLSLLPAGCFGSSGEKDKYKDQDRPLPAEAEPTPDKK